MLLRLVATLRGRRLGGFEGPVVAAAPLTAGHSGRGGGEKIIWLRRHYHFGPAKGVSGFCWGAQGASWTPHDAKLHRQ